MFNSEQQLIKELPDLLKKAEDGSFVVYQLFRGEKGEISLKNKTSFKNADDQFQYLWRLPPSIELIYVAMSKKTKRICYRGLKTSVAYDKIGSEPKLILFKDKRRTSSSIKSSDKVRGSVEEMGNLLYQGRK